MNKVDVVINVFGKPWQTLCTLKSLMKYNSIFIDKIYFIEEKNQLYDDDVKFIIEKFDNIIHFIPRYYSFMKSMPDNKSMTEDERYEYRYQYGIEKSNKKYLFITHNDILYTGNIIGEMLSEIYNNAGIGLIGQCWNCAAFKADICNGDKFESYNPTYDDFMNIISKFGSERVGVFCQLDRETPMPSPECRLNEFACLIDREIYIKECYPKGTTPFIGAMGKLDTGDSWFRSLILKGYKFKNYDIRKTSFHGYFSQLEHTARKYNNTESIHYSSGYSAHFNKSIYDESEELAKKYYEKYLL